MKKEKNKNKLFQLLLKILPFVRIKKKRTQKQVIKELLETAKKLPANTSITTMQLFTATYPEEEPDFSDMLRLAIEFSKHDRDAGLYFDSSHHWGLVEGLPCCLDFIIKQRKPDIHFDQINYIESSLTGSGQNLIINLQEKSIYYFNPTCKMEQVYKCSNTIWKCIGEIVRACDFDQWEQEYNDDNLSDGMQWKIKLLQNGKICKEICGSNKYPNAWRIFWSLKQMCIQLTKHEVVSICKPQRCPFCESVKIKNFLYRELTYLDKAENYIVVPETINTANERPKWGCADCGAKFIEDMSCFAYWI